MWWVLGAVAAGVVGVANAILNSLKQTASVERQRWNNEYQHVQREVVQYERQIQQRTHQAQIEVNFHVLAELHFESVKVANHAYNLLSDARTALDALGQAIHTAGVEKNRLIAEKKQTRSHVRRHELEQEISALISLRNALFPDKDQLKLQRDHFLQEVKRLNSETHALKLIIRDRCGTKGRDWYDKLEVRTQQRQLGLPVSPNYATTRLLTDSSDRQTDRIVTEAYQQVLERLPDPLGLTHYSAQLYNKKMTVRKIIRNLGTSQEYRDRFVVSLSHAEVVRLMYIHFLARQPESQDVINRHIHEMVRVGWEAVVENMIFSPEYNNRFGEHSVPKRPRS